MKTKILTFILIASASPAWATIYTSDGTEANIQSIHDNQAHNGDTITLPAGTKTWTTGIIITKGITITGQTTINGAGTMNPIVNDQTNIVDEKSRTAGGPLIKATVSAGTAFRLAGITFQQGTTKTNHTGGAVSISSIDGASDVRVHHLHFKNLFWEDNIVRDGWLIGVMDHCFIEAGPKSRSGAMRQASWNNLPGDNGKGYGSWADFPWYRYREQLFHRDKYL